MINLGDEVICKVTGFKGIVTAKTDYIHGCTRLSVQPKVSKDGKLPEMQAFDEPQLKVLNKAIVKRSHNETGGDRPTIKQAKEVRR